MGRKPTRPRVEYKGTRYLLLHTSGAIPFIEIAGLSEAWVRRAMQALSDEMKRASVVFEEQTGFKLYWVPGASQGFMWCCLDTKDTSRLQHWLRNKAKKMDEQIVSILKSKIKSGSSSPQLAAKT